MNKDSKLYAIMENAKFLFENKNEIIQKKTIKVRPTAEGFTVYSLESNHPMRGDNKAKKRDVDAINHIIEHPDFTDRGKEAANGFREDDVQARFALGMLNNEEQFEGIEFVTAEFVLEKENNRIDVLGVKDDTLYIFELKKSTTTKVFEQMAEYLEEMSSKYDDTYKEILQYYPNMNGRNIKKFVTIAVMPWSEHTKLRNKNVWLYEVPLLEGKDIIFHKY